VAGASYRFTPDTLAGFALGGAGSSFDIANGFGSGKADAFNAAVYAKHNIGAAYLAGLLGYSWQDTSTDRTVTISGADKLHASFKAQALVARLEGGWRYATPLVGRRDVACWHLAVVRSTDSAKPGTTTHTDAGLSEWSNMRSNTAISR
jgi:outer membrane autotransporter protein